MVKKPLGSVKNYLSAQFCPGLLCCLAQGVHKPHRKCCSSIVLVKEPSCWNLMRKDAVSSACW